ncbi:MAG: ABC transporter substrate-binding protein [Alphaproteobacteria bacterium]|nr:MAG: ABC transporter substrate-binding protein [Alphaproteobacteria bacterium]
MLPEARAGDFPNVRCALHGQIVDRPRLERSNAGAEETGGARLWPLHCGDVCEPSGERLDVTGEQKIKRGTMVQSRIVKSDGEPVSINYMVHDNAVGYQIRDVYVTGTISELATKRSEFATILRTNGIDGLIASLNKKADDLRG